MGQPVETAASDQRKAETLILGTHQDGIWLSFVLVRYEQLQFLDGKVKFKKSHLVSFYTEFGRHVKAD